MSCFFGGIDVSYSRADRRGQHRANYERNRKRILATQNTCGICGHPVDFSLKSPHPMSPTIDHIIPIAKGGHPSDIDNLQLAHWTCNRQKSDKIFKQGHQTKQVVGNRNLPQSLNWIEYSASDSNQQLNKQKENKQTKIKNNINKEVEEQTKQRKETSKKVIKKIVKKEGKNDRKRTKIIILKTKK